jgi:hypothetical protein
MEKTKQKNIYQKLLAIQQAIMGLGKDKAAFGYKYVTGDKVLEHLKPLMNEHGLLLKQEVLSIENTRQDYQTANGKAANEINSKVMMRFTWVDCMTGEKDENLFGANGQNAWDKGVGSALTYGERYFLLKYFHIATDEDDIDNPERKPQEAAQQAQPVRAVEANPTQANAQENAPHVLVAVKELLASKSREESGVIWKQYPQFQKEKAFIEAGKAVAAMYPKAEASHAS